jgi:protein subunit release factor A
MTGFYYHTTDFKAEEVVQKCVKRLDDIPTDFDEVTVLLREEASPSEILDTNLTEEWVAPNYTDTIVEFDTLYSELNEKSREKEIQRLREEKGQFFVLETEVVAGDTTYTVSALIEIRGRAGGGKTEFFVEEYQQGEAEIDK